MIFFTYFDNTPGIGIEANEQLSLEHFRLAAELNHSGSLYNLGILYAKGKGVEKSDIRALEYYHQVFFSPFYFGFF